MTNVLPTIFKDVYVKNALKVHRGVTKRISTLVASLVVGLDDAIAVDYLSTNRKEDFPWLVGCGAIASFVPYTFSFLVPIKSWITSVSVITNQPQITFYKLNNITANYIKYTYHTTKKTNLT